jgi:hypothetical protein
MTDEYTNPKPPEDNFAFLPDNALNLLEPDPRTVFALDVQNDAQELAHKAFPNNIYHLADDLFGLGVVSRALPDGSTAVLSAFSANNERYNCVKVVTDGATSTIYAHPDEIPSVLLKTTTDEQPRQITVDEVPPEHWSALASAKRGFEEGEKIRALQREEAAANRQQVPAAPRRGSKLLALMRRKKT